jgi:thiol-disulfide isomerase/thioredoxin
MQMNNRLRQTKKAIAFVALAATLAVSAFAKTNAKPTVVLIRAEWCGTCQKLEPTIKELAEQYVDRLNFVVLDVSTDETTAEAAATARRLGISRFFQENQQRTSTVAVFGKGNRLLFQTAANFDRNAYVKAFDDAIAKAGK